MLKYTNQLVRTRKLPIAPQEESASTRKERGSIVREPKEESTKNDGQKHKCPTQPMRGADSVEQQGKHTVH
jgi:hypothetical protein